MVLVESVLLCRVGTDNLLSLDVVEKAKSLLKN